MADEITLRKAVRGGYTPCSRCKPPRLKKYSRLMPRKKRYRGSSIIVDEQRTV